MHPTLQHRSTFHTTENFTPCALMWAFERTKIYLCQPGFWQTQHQEAPF